MDAPATAPVPAGVWAVASGLAGPADARTWAATAERAAAWSFRLPAGGERQAVAALRSLREGARFLAVHARSDWAAACGADAVIAGARSLPLEALAARAARHGLRLGRSTHAPSEVAEAAAAGAAFAYFGPVWDTPSKRGILQPRGLAGLRAACAFGIPVIAIGGVGEAEQVLACRQAGAHGVAVLRGARHARVLEALAEAWQAGA
ncbi:MAG: thiamine phosphate synthase [Planctomycetes bacterium]|nr:thiamine phosphate synthase [Planctomycetota bacterium]